MAGKERVEPILTEQTIEALVQKTAAKEAAGEAPVILDESEGARVYRENVEAIVAAAHANMEKIDQQAKDNLAISRSAIKPQEGTPYDSYGDPLDLNIAADMRLAQIALQDEEVSKKFLEKFIERIGKANAATITPLAMGNPSLLLTEANLKDVKEVAPSYWSKDNEKLFEQQGKTLLESAGFSNEIIARLDPSFLRYMGVTQKHEASFPVEGPGVAERLKSPSAKSMILDALGNKNVQRSLSWAGLAIGCVTGGIVIKAGMTGAKFLVSKLAENESVRAFSKTLENRSITFVSNALNIDEAKIRKNVDYAKGTAERLSGNKWVMLTGAAAMVGVAVAIGQIDFVRDTVQAVATNFGDGYDLAVDMVKPELEEWGILTESPTDAVAPVYVAPPVADAITPTQVAGAAGVEAITPPVPDAAGPANITPPVLDQGSVAGSTQEYQEFTAQRSGLTGNASDVKFPDSTNLGVNSGAGSALTVPDSTVNGKVDIASLSDGASGTSATPASHTVVKGDSLWKIAERQLEAGGGSASNQDIHKLVGQIYEANKDVIGSNPDLIFPGQELKLDGLHQGIEVSASRITEEGYNPVSQQEMASSTKLGVVSLEGAGTVTFPAINPNYGLVGSDGVAPVGNVNEIMKDFYKDDALKVADVTAPSKYGRGTDGPSMA